MLGGSDGFARGVGLVSPFWVVNELRRESDGLLHSPPGRTSWDASPIHGELDAVTLRVARDAAATEGWTARRRMRTSYQLARTVSLPTNIDPEKAEATLRDGVLEVSLPKVPDAQPRRIVVHSGPSN